MDSEQRAAHARAILDDEMVIAAFAALDAGCIATFRQPGLSDEDLRHAHYLLQMAGKFRAIFVQAVENGAIEKARASTARQAALRP